MPPRSQVELPQTGVARREVPKVPQYRNTQYKDTSVNTSPILAGWIIPASTYFRYLRPSLYLNTPNTLQDYLKVTWRYCAARDGI
jgi:hypothetical protein